MTQNHSNINKNFHIIGVVSPQELLQVKKLASSLNLTVSNFIRLKLGFATLKHGGQNKGVSTLPSKIVSEKAENVLIKQRIDSK